MPICRVFSDVQHPDNCLFAANSGQRLESGVWIIGFCLLTLSEKLGKVVPWPASGERTTRKRRRRPCAHGTSITLGASIHTSLSLQPHHFHASSSHRIDTLAS